ncbi:uncharacterized protein LOC143377335 [Andrena cerasifolii]|uniref:uncharacterized protein LOC143377335 n=1 Tax=Andrena cerasifolii TaxID=2819439 RepID=UPI004037E315
MTDAEYVGPQFQGIIQEFTRIRDAYVALKAYSDAQDDTLTMENERSERMKENLEKLSRAYLLLEQRYKSTLAETQNDKANLQETIEQLKEECNHLRLINTDRNGNDDQINRLQDEIEVQAIQLQLQKEKYDKTVTTLKQQHSDEIQKYKMLLRNAKQEAASKPNKKKGRPPSASQNKKHTSLFRWPELDVEIVGSAPTDNDETENRNDGNKKRKLFHEDRDAVVNIP